MDTDHHAAVDHYLDGLFDDEPVLAAAQERAEAAGLPQIQVSSNLGRFLHVLALARDARSILEIGTLAGYSTIWLARALPGDGSMVTLEIDPQRADVARANLRHAGLADQVDVRTGPALDTLIAMRDEGAGPFDMVFIDADKPPYLEYLHAVLELVRPGTLIVADNVIRGGRVALGPIDDDDVTGAQRFNEALAAHPRLSAAMIQQVGVKGHDGMALAVVRDPFPQAEALTSRAVQTGRSAAAR
jgi:caffeoyl-CoA O-methyltransferase